MREKLIVLVVRDDGLRAMLAGELASAGMNLVTASGCGCGCGCGERPAGRGDVLVIDERAIDGDREQWIEAQRLGGRWQRLVVLTSDSPAATGERDWLFHVERDSAAAWFAELLVPREEAEPA